jgi:hypothetical protein
MGIEEKRKLERETARKDNEIRRHFQNQREDRWDNVDDGDFRFTDWASI